MAKKRTVHVDVDLAHNKKYDEYYRDPKQLQLSSVLIGIFLIVFGIISLFKLDRTPVGFMALAAFVTVGIVFFAIAAVIPKKVGTPQTVYDTYPVSAAVIAEVDEQRQRAKRSQPFITILALVDAATDPEQGPVWALASRDIKALPGHTLEVGQRVPVVAVPGRRAVIKNKQHWADMTLLPICWATTKKSVINEAAGAVPEAHWRKLKKYASRVDEVVKLRTHLLILDD